MSSRNSLKMSLQTDFQLSVLQPAALSLCILRLGSTQGIGSVAAFLLATTVATLVYVRQLASIFSSLPTWA